MKVSENCFHCGQGIEKERISFDEKIFCCTGCKSVYEILNTNNLSNFYELNKKRASDLKKILLSLITSTPKKFLTELQIFLKAIQVLSRSEFR